MEEGQKVEPEVVDARGEVFNLEPGVDYERVGLVAEMAKMQLALDILSARVDELEKIMP